MSAHLRGEEFIEHLDGRLAPDRERHLVECDACRVEAAEWTSLTGAVRQAGEVPEPSPLFWDHFSRRVRAATASGPAPSRAWALRGWRPVGLLAGVAVAMVVAINLSQRTFPPQNAGTSEPLNPGTSEADVLFAVDGESWQFVTDLAATVPFEELRAIVAPDAAATDDIVSQLSGGERAELVRLMRLEKGSEE